MPGWCCACKRRRPKTLVLWHSGTLLDALIYESGANVGCANMRQAPRPKSPPTLLAPNLFRLPPHRLRVRTLRQCGQRPVLAPETPKQTMAERGKRDKRALISLIFFSERLLPTGEVVGSIPTAPTIFGSD